MISKVMGFLYWVPIRVYKGTYRLMLFVCFFSIFFLPVVLPGIMGWAPLDDFPTKKGTLSSIKKEGRRLVFDIDNYRFYCLCDIDERQHLVELYGEMVVVGYRPVFYSIPARAFHAGYVEYRKDYIYRAGYSKGDEYNRFFYLSVVFFPIIFISFFYLAVMIFRANRLEREYRG